MTVSNLVSGSTPAKALESLLKSIDNLTSIKKEGYNLNNVIDEAVSEFCQLKVVAQKYTYGNKSFILVDHDKITRDQQQLLSASKARTTKIPGIFLLNTPDIASTAKVVVHEEPEQIKIA